MNFRLRFLLLSGALLILFGLLPRTVLAQLPPVDYSDLDSWVAHPDKFTFLENYSADIAVINPDLTTDTVLARANNYSTNTGVDIFYVYPTLDDQLDPVRQNIALSDQNNFRRVSVAGAQAGPLLRYGRLFAPFYRQANLATYLFPTDSTQRAILTQAYRDVRRAFDYYLQNHNNGNRIILVSHSQGSQMLGMLLRDRFDNNPQLRSQLVIAVLGGLAFGYTPPGQQTGGWWENLPICGSPAAADCGCVLAWRSYPPGYALGGLQANRPCNDPALVDSGYVFTPLDTAQHLLRMDSTLFGSQPAPLPLYIAPNNSNRPYGGSAGFVAFDSLYTVNYRQESNHQVGLTFDYTPAPNDQRPNEPANDTSSLSADGYHNYDFQLYLWAVLQHTEARVNNCTLTGTAPTAPASGEGALPFRAWPNPVADELRLRANEPLRLQLRNLQGQVVARVHLAPGATTSFSVAELPAGLYLLQGSGHTQRVVVE